MKDTEQSGGVGELKPAIPIKVLRSNLPQFPADKAKDIVEGATAVEVKKIVPKVDSGVADKLENDTPKGTILIKLYRNKRYETEFKGEITGMDRDIAWRAMMKGYMVWKSNLSKQGGK